MNGPLKVHGGKHYLAQRIVSLMPKHNHYVEPFAGGLSVLLAKECEGVSEVVNDLDGNFTTFFRVLQDEALFAQFQRRVQAIPFSQREWEKYKFYLDTRKDQGTVDPVEQAVAFFVVCRQSMSGRCQQFSPLSRSRTRNGMNEQVSSWLTSIDGLAPVHARLIRVVILNLTAMEVLQSDDGPDTLFYLDPPYMPETRAAKKVFGKFDMTAENHEELLDTIIGLQGMVMISGYASPLYDARLASWTRHEFDLPNNAGKAKHKRRMTECVWCNFRSAQQEVA